LKQDNKSVAINTILLLGLLYIFLMSIGLLGSSLKLFGKPLAEALISTTNHPIVGLFLGILATSIVQSSSMTTSLVVALVAGGMITVENAIPMVLGANIGTTITNLLVSMAHINRSNEFRLAFAAATVHDIFNILSVIIIMPLQVATDFLGKASIAMADVFAGVGGLKMFNPLKAVTTPAINLILDLINHSAVFGVILALILLFLSLNYIVKLLKRVFIGKITTLFQKYIFKTTLRSFTVGLLITVIVQSSSVTTSLIIPLAGSGILNLIQIFPYTLGANLGTTGTAILASLATGNVSALAIAFAHMLFNICGIFLFLILPLKKIPIYLAEKLAESAAKSKLIPVGFVAFLFFILPLILISIWR